MNSLTLSDLGPETFEHLVNELALKVLGPGLTLFGAGPDGGRDGLFEGSAPYPSNSQPSSGTWYIQSKFHAPSLSKNHHDWLYGRVENEIRRFNESPRRKWPDIWIIATNIDPSGAPETGAFDRIRRLVARNRQKLSKNFHIWGGAKILALLNQHQDVAARYGHLMTPGHVLVELRESLSDSRAPISELLRSIVVREMDEHQYMKLEQAGAKLSRPRVHQLFVDLPFRSSGYNGSIGKTLAICCARNHQSTAGRGPRTESELLWEQHPTRARVWFIRSGPGQGKSTVTQFYAQVQRAALALELFSGESNTILQLADEIKTLAARLEIWPKAPRLPITVELKAFAKWFSIQNPERARGIFSFLAYYFEKRIEQSVEVGTIKRALRSNRWMFVFDGLDEVPADIKDEIAEQVRIFVEDTISVGDIQIICTSRPQGYSGQFDSIAGAVVELSPLSPTKASECAEKLLAFGVSSGEFSESKKNLQAALDSKSVQELMTTPLQSHIMATIIRSGQRPPEKKWELYRTFYDVSFSREAGKGFPSSSLPKLLRDEHQLIKAIHGLLGFALHSDAETSQGALSTLSREDFQALIQQAVICRKGISQEPLIEAIMKATTERLVLINTPDEGSMIRFDIRQLQEFFAGEFLYDGGDPDVLQERIELVASDAHWREAVHFALSALIENGRRGELRACVSAIGAVDLGTEFDGDRELRSRLAVGASIVLRLLIDGVLEQDETMRALFRHCIEPLGRSQCPSLLEAMLRVGLPASRNWLCERMIELLEASHASETVGCSFYLWHTLSEADARLDRAISKWTRDRYKGLLPAIAGSPLERGKKVLRDWQIGFLHELCFSDEDWRENYFYHQLVNASMHLSGKDSLSRTFECRELVSYFGLFRVEPEQLFLPADPEAVVEVVQFEYAKPVLNFSKMKAALDAAGTAYLYRLNSQIVALWIRPNLDSLLSFLELLGSTWSALECVPQRLARLIKSNVQLRTPLELIKELTGSKPELQFTDVLHQPKKSIKFQEYRQTFMGRTSMTEESFGILIGLDPTLAISLWNSSDELKKSSTVQKLVRSRVESSLELARRLDPFSWNYLFDHSQRRNILKLAFSGDTLLPATYGWGRPKIEDCPRLELPEDAFLLPPLLESLSLLASPRYQFFDRFSLGDDEIDDTRPAELSQDVVTFSAPDAHSLVMLADDSEQELYYRAAALLFLAGHSGGGVHKLVESIQVFQDLFRVDLRLLRHLLVSVRYFGSPFDTELRRALSKLLSSLRYSSAAIGRWSSLLETWREASNAPVTRQKLKQTWIDRSLSGS